MTGPWEQFQSTDQGPWTQFAPVAPPPPEKQSAFRQVADIPLGIAKGAVQGVRMIADAFGAGSDTSNTIKSAETYLADLMSAQSKNDQQEISRIIKDAEDKGVLDQVKAGIKAFTVAPVDTLSSALGTAAPVIVGALGAKVLGAGALVSTGVSALTGAGMGAGVVKGAIYEETKDTLKKAGASDEEAERRAQLAQQYNGKNLDQILLGTVLGGAAAVGPLEKGGAAILARRILGKTGTEATETVAEQTAKGALRRRAEAGVLEAIPEAVQAGQEQIAQNIALQREGFDVPTMRGVASAATLEALAGAGLGAAIGGGRPDVIPPALPPQVAPSPAQIAEAPPVVPSVAERVADITGVSREAPLSAEEAAETFARMYRMGDEEGRAYAERITQERLLRLQQEADANAAAIAEQRRREGAPPEVPRPPAPDVTRPSLAEEVPAVPSREELLAKQAEVDRRRLAAGLPTGPSSLTPGIEPEVTVPEERPVPRLVDNRPLTEGAARNRLLVMRNMLQNQGGDPESLTIVPHPTAEGRFAIQSLERPVKFTKLEATAGEKPPSEVVVDPVNAYVEEQRRTDTPAARRFVSDFEVGRITREDVQQAISAERRRAAPPLAVLPEGEMVAPPTGRARPTPSAEEGPPVTFQQRLKRLVENKLPFFVSVFERGGRNVYYASADETLESSRRVELALTKAEQEEADIAQAKLDASTTEEARVAAEAQLQGVLRKAASRALADVEVSKFVPPPKPKITVEEEPPTEEPPGEEPPPPSGTLPTTLEEFRQRMPIVFDKAEVREANNEGNFTKLTKALQLSSNPAIRRIGKLGAGIASKITLRKPGSSRQLGAGVAGVYRYADDSIQMHREHAGNEHTNAHETLHALISKAQRYPTERQKPVVAQIEKLYEHVKKELKRKGVTAYGLTNAREFTAEAMTNPEFQFELMQIPYPGKKSAWTQFVKLVADLLGIQNTNALTEVMNLVDRLAMQKQPRKTVTDKGLVDEAKRESDLDRWAKHKPQEIANMEQFANWSGSKLVGDPKTGKPVVFYVPNPRGFAGKLTPIEYPENGLYGVLAEPYKPKANFLAKHDNSWMNENEYATDDAVAVPAVIRGSRIVTYDELMGLREQYPNKTDAQISSIEDIAFVDMEKELGESSKIVLNPNNIVAAPKWMQMLIDEVGNKRVLKPTGPEIEVKGYDTFDVDSALAQSVPFTEEGLTDEMDVPEEKPGVVAKATAAAQKAMQKQPRKTVTDKGLVDEMESERPPTLDTSVLTKVIKGRDPQVQAAAQQLKEGKITREQYEQYVNYYTPIEAVEADKLLPPSTEEAMRGAVASNKANLVNQPISDGAKVGLRLDIPATRAGVPTVSVHEGASGKASQGKAKSYTSTAHITNATFEPRSQKAGLEIAVGAGKEPLQTVEGTWVNEDPQSVFEKVKGFLRSPDWVQVGFDPTRHGYFYDRKTGEPVASASEVYQIGTLLVAKDVKYAPKSQFMYSLRSKQGLYSELENKIAQGSNKAPAASWKAYINGLTQKGVKPEEIEWSGVRDWLDLQKGTVTKDDLLNYLKQGGVKVEETVLGGTSPELRDLRKRMTALRDKLIAAKEDFQNSGYLYREISSDDVLNSLPEKWQLRYDKISRMQEEYDKLSHEEYDSPAAVPPKYSQYTLPGGENYREVLLTLPSKVDYLLSIGASDSEVAAAPRNYRSSHWDQPNVLAHIRLNDRIDADGKKVLFVEEIQSDWGQEGKKKGFADKSVSMTELLRQYDALNAERRSVERTVAEGDDADPATQAAVDRASEINRQLNALSERMYALRYNPPAAPFVTKTEGWLNLALKRIMVMAAEGGYDKVAFVNGDQSADRYDLSKQIDRIDAKRKSNGMYELDFATKDGRDFNRDLNEAELEANVGKEMAKKIIDATQEPNKRVRFSGLDLKVGGEGMKTFYDQIVPMAVKKLLPKVGGGQMTEVQVPDAEAERGKVYDIVVASERVADRDSPVGSVVETLTSRRMAEQAMEGESGYDKRDYRIVERNAGNPMLTQLGFDVTPAMREKVETTGLPLFSKKGVSENQLKDFEQTLRALMNKFGLKDVGLSIIEGMQDSGSYAQQLIRIAASADNPVRTLRHEAIHALREMGFFTDAQWKSLSKMAKDKWIDQYLKQRNVDGKPLKAGEESRYDAYMREYEGNMEKITEEAVADAFADFEATKPPAGMLAALLKRLKDLFQSIKSALTKVESPEQIFGKVEKGEMKAGEKRQAGERKSVRDRATANFLRWFGDSKVVDEKGEPLVVYHGTGREFTKFKRRPQFFTPQKDWAQFHAEGDVERQRDLGRRYDGKSVMDVYLSIQNPMYLDGNRLPRDAYLDNYDTQVKQAKRLKHDGIIISNTEGGTEYIVFRPEQIKSATGNNGDYSLTNADIRKSLSGKRSTQEVARIFGQMVKRAEKELSSALFNWNDSRLNEDKDKIVVYPGRDQRFVRGKEGGKSNVSKAEFIDWLMSDAPFDTSVYGEEITRDAEWNSEIETLRSIVTTPDIRKSLGKATAAAQKALQKQSMPEKGLSHVSKDLTNLAQPIFFPQNKTILDRIDSMKDRFWQRLAQKTADQFRTIKEYSPLGYMQARLSKSIDGSLEGLLFHGQVFDDGGALNIKSNTKGMMDILKPIGNELDSYLMWVALNREARLSEDKRSKIPNMDKLVARRAEFAAGELNGKPRVEVYQDVLRQMNQLNKSVLDIALAKGIINQEGYDKFSNDIYYIPFYKKMEEDGTTAGAQTASGLTSQYFSKELKGSEAPFGDLMENIVRNWSHILSASMKNAAAQTTIDDAMKLQAAEPNLKAGLEMRDGVVYSTKSDKPIEAKFDEDGKQIYAEGELRPDLTTSGTGMAKIMVDGQPMYFKVTDELLMDSISSIGYMGPKSKFLDVARGFKNMLQYGVTASPIFKVNNLIRDSISALAVSDLKKSPVYNVMTGISLSKKDSPTYISALAGGGIFNFGSAYEGDQAKLIKRLIDQGVDGDTILDSKEKITKALKKTWDAYQHLGDRSEAANRLALYQQMRDKGMSHLQASFMARDLLDFSMQGSWPAFRLITQVVPFMNARIQGLYKLGRDGINPTVRVLYNATTGKEIDANDKVRAAQFSTVTAAVMLASAMLYLSFKDDEDFKKRDAWDRDNFWWFKIPSLDIAFRVPKPFEVGAFGTLVERSLEQILDQGAEGKTFGDSLKRTLWDTFALNPTPQMFKPLFDLYANKDSFSGAPIESAGLERLSKQERMTEQTSPLAIALSKVWSTVMPEKVESSPVQVDYAIKGYFGWLGAMASMASTYAVMPFKEGEYPDARWLDRASLGLVRDLPAPQSAYVTAFYENAKEISQAYADMRHYREMGDAEKVQEILEKSGDKIALAKFYDKTSKNIANVRKQIQFITNDKTLDGATKKEEIERMKLIMSNLAKQAEEVRKSMKP